MKRIIAIIGAVMALFAVSCSKMQPETGNTDTINLNISISPFNGDGTRAVKTGWVAGDKLNLWFKCNDLNHQAPDLVITFDGTKWSAGPLREGAVLKESGDKMITVYESYNGLTSGMYRYQWYMGRAWYHPVEARYDVNCAPLTVYSPWRDYSFTANTLTATLDEWVFCTGFKVLVKDDKDSLNKEGKDYYLTIKNNTDSKKLPDSKGALLIDDNSVGYGSSNYEGMQGGVREPDGIAFYYCRFHVESSDLTFVLSEREGNSFTQKTYSVTGATIDADKDDRCIGVVVNHSSFK